MNLFTPILDTFNIKNYEEVYKNITKYENKPYILISFNNKVFTNNVQDNFILSISKKANNFILIEPGSEIELLDILLSNNKLINAVEYFCKIVDIKIDINKFLSELYYIKYNDYFSKLKFINFKDELNNFIFNNEDIYKIIEKSKSDKENYRIVVFKIFESISAHVTLSFQNFFKYLIDKQSIQPYFNAYLLRLTKIEKEKNTNLTKKEIENQLKYFRDQELKKPLSNYIKIIED